MFAEGASSLEIFYVTALAPLCVGVASFWINDKKVTNTVEQRNVEGENWRFFLKKMINGFIHTDMWKYCVVTTMYSLIPEPGAAYFYYYQDVMEYEDFQLQMISLAAEVGLLAGNFIFIWKLRSVHPKKMLIISTLLVTACNMWHPVLLFLVQAPPNVKLMLIYMYEFVTAIADVFLFMPFYIMGAKLCTAGVEGTSYALVHSIQNIGSFLDSFFASSLMNMFGIVGKDMDHLWYMSWFCAVLFLSPLMIIDILPEQEDIVDQSLMMEKVE